MCAHVREYCETGSIPVAGHSFINSPTQKGFTMNTPKFPHVRVQLVGMDGNAFSILGRVTAAMRKAGVKNDDVSAYTQEATSGDYDNLLRVTMQTVTVTDSTDDDDED